ncbi:MAG: 4Fe-4S dicluster domain-containing protein [Candidatus Bathyarchaeia archaeon]
MPKVFNWQIGREMEYWYEEARPRRQMAAVFDTNKCIACQSCTMACKTTWTSGKGQESMWWNSVETKPWGSYPLAWDVKLLNLLGPQTWSGDIYTGKTIFEAAPAGERVLGFLPDDIDWAYPNKGEDETNAIIDESKYHLRLPHDIWFFYVARVCNHCTYPACLSSCPRTAIYKRPEDGIVLVDQQRCRGYRECVRACPYKRTMYNHVTRIAEKCIFCYPAVEHGLWPRCMRNCIGKIRLFGWLNTPDKADPENPMDFLVHIKKLALPLFPQFGLEPNVYYIPPVHVPAKFTTQMFGPGVEKAAETYKRIMNGEEPEARGLLMLFVSTDRIFSRFKVTDKEAIGFSENGAEIVRVPLKEPTIIRPYFDAQLEVYRHNMP